MSANVNRKAVLASRPDGHPAPSDFRIEEVPYRGDGGHEVLLADGHP